MIAVGCLTVIVLALVAILYAQQHAHTQERVQVALERRELLTRIQRPEYVPINPDHVELPEQPADEWNLVNTVTYDPDAD